MKDEETRKKVFGQAFLVVLAIIVVANVAGYALHAILGWKASSVIEFIYIGALLYLVEDLLKWRPQARKAKVSIGGEDGFYESYEHKWTCPYPGCSLRVSANQREILATMVNDHLGVHLGR